MNLPDQIKLIDDMISESPDYTVADYLSLCAEIQNIEKGIFMPNPGIDIATQVQVLKMAADFDYKTIHKETGLGISAIYRYLKRAGVDLKEKRDRLKEQREAEALLVREEEIKRRLGVAQEVIKTPVIPEKWKRPAAIYSNSRPYDTLHNQKTA